MHNEYQTEPMEKRDFIITSLEKWDSASRGNAKDIALELSKENKVLYVNSYGGHSSVKQNRLDEVSPNLWVLNYFSYLFPVNRLPDNFMFDAVNRLNNRQIFREINRCASKLGFHNAIHFCDNDVYRSFYAREMLSASLFIYYRRDNLHPVSYWQRHIQRLEPELIKKSDLVMCNSSELAAYALPYKDAEFVLDIGQGVDLSLFRPECSYDKPEECRKISGPIIGYAGNISSNRLDVDLLYTLAVNRPQYTFLLVGECDRTFATHKINQLSNVLFTGLKPMEQIPAYISAMNVCLNPQLINEITIGNYPRKIDEYLAMGKPIVATKTQTMRLFEKYVYLCSSPNDYLEAMDSALHLDSATVQQERIKFAHTHSWAHCIEKIHKEITKYESSKSL
jgi:glycosyltransferase involved in cell wall biosynthesis